MTLLLLSFFQMIKRMIGVQFVFALLSLILQPVAAVSEDNILKFIPAIINAKSKKPNNQPSFLIKWPFSRDTLLGGINYFDHNQTNNFDPWNGYYDSGLALNYFCRENRDQFKVELFNANGHNYWVRQTYGHHGTDYYLPVGTPILAVADGLVSMRNDDIYERDRVKIYHDNGWVTIYAHSLIRDTKLHNTRVSAGEQIALITDSYLEMDRGSKEIDGTVFWEFHFEMYRPNSDNASGYSAVDPYYGTCSNLVANPDKAVYFSNGAPLEFLQNYVD